MSNSKPQKQKQTNSKVRQVQELRRSNASGPHQQRRRPEPQVDDWDDDENDHDLIPFWEKRD